jgi:PIN domain
MHVFLDSNIIFSDPFFKGNFSRKFLEMLKEVEGKLYIASVVYEESLNNYRREIRKRRKDFGKEMNNLNKLLKTEIETSIIHDEIFLKEFKEFYQELIDQGILKIISHLEFDMFNEIVSRALLPQKPFAHGKEEFKDTVIWLTYANYVEKNEISPGYFISNNTTDFYAKDKKTLHPDLLQDTKRFLPFKSIEEFMKEEAEQIEELQRKSEELRFEKRLDKLITWSEENLRQGLIQEIIENTFLDVLDTEIYDYVNNLSPHELSLIAGDDFELAESNGILKVLLSTFEREIYPEEIIVYGSLYVLNDVSLYLWNSFRDKGEDPYIYSGSTTIEHTIEFTFSIDDSGEASNFEVKDIETIKEEHFEPDDVDPTDIF